MAAVCWASTADGAVWVLQANLDRAQEVPAPVVPPGEAIPPSGVAILQYDDVAKTFDLQVSANGITEDPLLASIFQVLTNSHIHLAPPGVPGGVIVPLGGPAVYTEPLPGFVQGVFNDVPFPVANEAALLTNNTYINLHTQENGTGEIRGQLIVVIPEPVTLGLLTVGSLGLLLRRRTSRA